MNTMRNWPMWCVGSLLMAGMALAQNVPGRIKGEKREKDSPSYASYQLVAGAWAAYEAKDYHRASVLAIQCVKDYAPQAADQQAALGKQYASARVANDFWALNDVGTACYIRGLALEKTDQAQQARAIYGEIAKRYPGAQCFDPGKDAYWMVAAAAKDRIACIDLHIDYGDYKSSTLTSRAWDSLKQKRALAAVAYADKCVELYGEQAREMQATLRDFPTAGTEWDYWALNDVGTCLFIKGKAFDSLRREVESRQAYQEVLGTYSYAQCWDNSNEWFWKVSEAARKLLFKNKEL